METENLWISVEDRLPEPGCYECKRTCLDCSTQVNCKYEGGGIWLVGNFVFVGITHYRRIPVLLDQ
jgi:hypothetical protein